MPKPNETSLGSKLNLGIGEISVLQKFIHEDICITEPKDNETNKPRILIRGLGVKKGWRVLLVNEVLGSGCYLQDSVGESTAKGEWKALAKFSERSSGADRIIYALAVKEKDLDLVCGLLAQSQRIKTITEAESILAENKIVHNISIGKRLVYRKNKTSDKKP